MYTYKHNLTINTDSKFNLYCNVTLILKLILTVILTLLKFTLIFYPDFLLQYEVFLHSQLA